MSSPSVVTVRGAHRLWRVSSSPEPTSNKQRPVLGKIMHDGDGDASASDEESDGSPLRLPKQPSPMGTSAYSTSPTLSSSSGSSEAWMTLMSPSRQAQSGAWYEPRVQQRLGVPMGPPADATTGVARNPSPP